MDREEEKDRDHFENWEKRNAELFPSLPYLECRLEYRERCEAAGYPWGVSLLLPINLLVRAAR